MSTPILMAASRIVVALMLVFSLFVLLRGHNEPGGGFIGGLIGAAGFALLALSHGVDTARKALRIPPAHLAALGVLTALGAGLFSALFLAAPFTGLWFFVGGETHPIPLSTVLVFDLGVWMVVVGAALTLVFALEEIV